MGVRWDESAPNSILMCYLVIFVQKTPSKNTPVPARSGCCQDGNSGESRGKEMHAYRTEAATDEKDLLKTFRFVVEDHAANGGRNGRDTNNGSPYGFLVTLASFSTIHIANQVLLSRREVSARQDAMTYLVG